MSKRKNRARPVPVPNERPSIYPLDWDEETGQPVYFVEGRYFAPDETVAVAFLLREVEADRHGEVRAKVAMSEIPRNAEAVLLIGYDTGGFCHDSTPIHADPVGLRAHLEV
ncbi:hypothetical protein [Microbacterium sp. YY-01]|uniref:hypothetical protein n=1 Tax=Microbacterium sp. YY-01 TaxID=3421634 RepID=UPI003D183D2F